MSNNQRWVRIPTFEMFTALLAVPNVVIAEFKTYDKVSDAANFVELLFENDADSHVKVVNPTWSRVLRAFEFNSFYSRDFTQLSYAYRYDANLIKESGEFRPDVHQWLKTRLIDEQFNPANVSGFYLLQEAVLKTELLPIIEATDVPADGIVYYDNRPHFLTEYPSGLFHLMYYDEFDNETNLVGCNITDLSDIKVSKNCSSWRPLCINLNTVHGLDESFKHLKETFVSISGDTPDEWFDKQNEGVI